MAARVFRSGQPLSESEYFFRESQRAAAIGSYKTDFLADRWESSEVLDEIFGIGPDYQRSVQGWLALVHADDQTMMAEHLRDEVIAKRQKFCKEYRIRRHSDGSERWVYGLGEMTFGQNGQPLSLIGTIQDITERKLAEFEKDALQTQLQQSQKMESLGVLAGGIAHDMNNVLAAILTIASTRCALLPSDDPNVASFQKIATAAARGGRMVKGLLSFARKGRTDLLPVDLNALIDEETALLEKTVPAGVRVVTEKQAKLGTILGDSDALIHALMNLCVNAFDAMGAGGTLVIRTRQHDLSEVRLEVEDTGVGMSPEVVEKALNPFFTTKPVGKGTGLGLSVVDRTVQAHHGHIDIASVPGQGTKVVLRFPVNGSAGVGQVAKSSRPPAELPSLTILVVDDDEMVRETLGEMLTFLGHTVTLSTGGEEAQRHLEAGLKADLIVLDMNMPGLTGAQTLPRLRSVLPEVPVLLSSGHHDKAVLALAEAFPRVTLLPKPYDLDTLRRALAL